VQFAKECRPVCDELRSFPGSYRPVLLPSVGCFNSEDSASVLDAGRRITIRWSFRTSVAVATEAPAPLRTNRGRDRPTASSLLVYVARDPTN